MDGWPVTGRIVRTSLQLAAEPCFGTVAECLVGHDRDPSCWRCCGAMKRTCGRAGSTRSRCSARLLATRRPPRPISIWRFVPPPTFPRGDLTTSASWKLSGSTWRSFSGATWTSSKSQRFGPASGELSPRKACVPSSRPAVRLRGYPGQYSSDPKLPGGDGSLGSLRLTAGPETPWERCLERISEAATKLGADAEAPGPPGRAGNGSRRLRFDVRSGEGRRWNGKRGDGAKFPVNSLRLTWNAGNVHISIRGNVFDRQQIVASPLPSVRIREKGVGWRGTDQRGGDGWDVQWVDLRCVSAMGCSPGVWAPADVHRWGLGRRRMYIGGVWGGVGCTSGLFGASVDVHLSALGRRVRSRDHYPEPLQRVIEIWLPGAVAGVPNIRTFDWGSCSLARSASEKGSWCLVFSLCYSKL